VGVSGDVTAAVIAGSVAFIAAAVGSYFTVLVAHRQRSVDLIISAFADMEGGTQKRGAAVAALSVLRGDPRTQPHGYMNRRLWRTYGPAVGEQLFRTEAYVLKEADQKTHGIEIAISIMDWLLTDAVLGFDDKTSQRTRLAAYAAGYAAAISPRSSPDSAASAFVGKLPDWTLKLVGVKKYELLYKQVAAEE
jgi:hypothetical protein